jgi:hypothetical protein
LHVDVALDRRNSMLFGLYHHVHSSIARDSRPFYDPDILMLTGGAGELLRAHYQVHGLQTDDFTTPYSSGGLIALLEAKRGTLLSPEQFAVAADLYRETFDGLQGDTVWRRLDSHYLSFRNRFHFGAPSAVRPRSVKEWHPIVSPALIKASLVLPSEVRATGRVLFDVTRELCEELAYCRHGKQPMDYSKARYHKPSPLDGTIIEVDPDPEMAKPPPTAEPATPSSPPIDFIALMGARTEDNLSRIAQSALAEFAGERSIRSVAWLRQKQSPNLQRMFSLTDGIVNYLDVA